MYLHYAVTLGNYGPYYTSGGFGRRYWVEDGDEPRQPKLPRRWGANHSEIPRPRLDPEHYVVSGFARPDTSGGGPTGLVLLAEVEGQDDSALVAHTHIDQFLITRLLHAGGERQRQPHLPLLAEVIEWLRLCGAEKVAYFAAAGPVVARELANVRADAFGYWRERAC